MKYISFSVYGQDLKYLAGIKKNIGLINIFYPDYKIVVFCDKNVMLFFNSYQKNVLSIDMDGFSTPLFWRFLVHDFDDCERFIARDADSRITKREALAVKEWEKEGKVLHIMRDHAHHHYKIMGGAWGMIKQKDFNMKKEIDTYVKGLKNPDKKMNDMDFLRDVIYPKYKDNSTIHASVHQTEAHAKSFPVKMDKEKHFVGEIINADESREPQYKWWLNRNEL